MKLSVLDQSIASRGRPEGDAIQESLELALRCDEMGFHRYWVSEHHNSECIVGTSPEILMAGIAATTSNIRIGSAGVMLPHYSPYKVAEQFRVLEGIAPGRIDLGLGRAPGSDRLTAFALNPQAASAAEQFPQAVLELKAWVMGEPLPDQHPFAKVSAHPAGETYPQMWMLGSSDYGAQLAAHLGMPYAYAYFFMDGRGVERALALYRDNYQPSDEFPEPKATICVWALLADSEKEAWYQFGSRQHWRIGFEKGVREALMSPQEAAGMQYGEAESQRIEQIRDAAFVGTKETVSNQLNDLCERLDLDELVVVTWTHEPQARQRSYELLADAYGLNNGKRR